MGDTSNGGAVCAVTPSASVLEIFHSRQGEGPCVGDAHVFIRFGGCNLSCDYCDTPASIPMKSGTRMTLEDVLDRVEALHQAHGPSVAVSLTGGEPLLHVGFLQHLIPRLRERGSKIYLETNGTLPEALKKIVDDCDWISMDFKPDSATGQDSWEAHQWFLETGGSKVFVKLVLTDQTTEAEVQRAVDLLRRVQSRSPLILQPATRQGDTHSVPMARLVSWWHQASQQLPDVRILPQVHRLWGVP